VHPWWSGLEELREEAGVLLEVDPEVQENLIPPVSSRILFPPGWSPARRELSGRSPSFFLKRERWDK